MIDTSEIRRQLEDKLRELTVRAEEIDDDLRQPTDDDWEEAATESADDETLEEIGELAVEEIAQIKLAIARIDAGTYGLCSECGEEIGEPRLRALPNATKCVKCA